MPRHNSTSEYAKDQGIDLDMGPVTEFPREREPNNEALLDQSVGSSSGLPPEALEALVVLCENATDLVNGQNPRPQEVYGAVEEVESFASALRSMGYRKL